MTGKFELLITFQWVLRQLHGLNKHQPELECGLLHAPPVGILKDLVIRASLWQPCCFREQTQIISVHVCGGIRSCLWWGYGETCSSTQHPPWVCVPALITCAVISHNDPATRNLGCDGNCAQQNGEISFQKGFENSVQKSETECALGVLKLLTKSSVICRSLDQLLAGLFDDLFSRFQEPHQRPANNPFTKREGK